MKKLTVFLFLITSFTSIAGSRLQCRVFIHDINGEVYLLDAPNAGRNDKAEIKNRNYTDKITYKSYLNFDAKFYRNYIIMNFQSPLFTSNIRLSQRSPKRTITEPAILKFDTPQLLNIYGVHLDSELMISKMHDYSLDVHSDLNWRSWLNFEIHPASLEVTCVLSKYRWGFPNPFPLP